MTILVEILLIGVVGGATGAMFAWLLPRRSYSCGCYSEQNEYEEDVDEEEHDEDLCRCQCDCFSCEEGKHDGSGITTEKEDLT